MTKLIVDVNNRKIRADTKVYSSSVLEQVKKQRQEQNRKRLGELHREINKLVRSK